MIGKRWAVAGWMPLVAAAAACCWSSLRADDAPQTKAGFDEDYPRATLAEATSGEDLSLVDARGNAATVLVCLSIECPISNEYLPTITTIAKAYSGRGVSFVGVHPGGTYSLAEMAAYARENKLPFPFVQDAEGKLTRQLRYSVTPEARVFDASGKLVYSGRIDDRYRAGGGSDPNVARDLERALDEVLSGKPVSASRTRPVGCPIQIAPVGGKS